MKKFRLIGTTLIAVLMCAIVASCGGNSNNKTAEGQKALDAAVRREGHTFVIENNIKIKAT